MAKKRLSKESVVGQERLSDLCRVTADVAPRLFSLEN